MLDSSNLQNWIFHFSKPQYVVTPIYATLTMTRSPTVVIIIPHNVAITVVKPNPGVSNSYTYSPAIPVANKMVETKYTMRDGVKLWQSISSQGKKMPGFPIFCFKKLGWVGRFLCFLGFLTFFYLVSLCDNSIHSKTNCQLHSTAAQISLFSASFQDQPP